MNIAIIGTGYVGLVTGVCLSHIGHNVRCYDIDRNRISMLNNGISPIYEKDLEKLMKQNKKRLIYSTDINTILNDVDIIFLTVDTPSKNDGSADLSHVFDACLLIAQTIKKDSIVVIKSTVPVGTSEMIEKFFKINSKYNIHVVSNPEFLSQGSAVKDTLYASRIVVGCDKSEVTKVIKEMYAPLLKEPYNVPFIEVKRNSAEIVKYACNNFLAVKLSYINEIANFCKKNDADIEEVTNCMKLDSRIGKEYLQAGIGYGGSCLPKDTHALYEMGKFKMVKAAIEVNENQNLILCNQLLKDFNNSTDKLQIAILGLTFKANTDDVRNSPAISNIELLLKKGVIIKVYDPVGIDNFQKHFENNKNITYCKTISESLKYSDAVLILNDWTEIKNISLELFVKKMNSPRIYDGGNCFSLNYVNKFPVYYYSIGRKTINNLN